MTRVGIYARYSSDKQKPSSIDDQLRDCRAEAARQGWTVVDEQTDPELSGASMITRPGLRAILEGARNGNYDVVLAEDLDRISRDLADPAIVFREMNFAGVRIVTLSDGVVGPLHIGFKGTMNAVFLDNLRQKTRRGLRGQVERGKSGGGLSYGYRLDRTHLVTNENGELEPERGLLTVHHGEADVVVRLMGEFARGISPKASAKALNAQGILGPRGRAWSPSTIHGHAGRGTGILNNELYVGKRIWNRQRFVKDPRTGKRVARLNPCSEWIVSDVPHLQIVPDELWQAVKARQAATRRTMQDGIVRARRPKYLFSKLTKCGVCGGGFTLSSRDTLRCFNNTTRGTCDNGRTITRQELEGRVLRAMQARFFEPGRFDEFCRVFTEEMNRLRREHRTKLSAAPREIAAIDERQKQILDYMNAGFGGVEAWKEEVRKNEARRAELQAIVAAADAEPLLPALHPRMADVFRETTMQLAAALEHSDEAQRESARQAIRGLIDRIVIPPGDGLLQVVGNLGEMLTAAGGRSASAAVGYVGCGGGI